MTSRFEILVAAPGEAFGFAAAVAACRAGALGLLGADAATEPASLVAALARMDRLARGACGLRLPSTAAGLAESVRAAGTASLSTVVLDGPHDGGLPAAVAGWRATGRRVLVEVLDEDEARAAVAAGADGLLAKGSEAGGRVAEETSFVLLQRLGGTACPVVLQGGIGPATAAAAAAGGAAGVLLDWQVCLARDSGIDDLLREAVAALDGSETEVVATPGGRRRVAARPLPGDAGRRRDLGQEVGLAAALARRFVTVGGVVAAVRDGAGRHLTDAARLRPLDEGAPLARSLGLRFPVVQGPMARVSDCPAFAEAVAGAGALPVVAVSLATGAELEALLDEARRRLEGRPWGVGLLGFLPPELWQAQVAAVLARRPPVAVLAGARPEQARELEAAGVAAFAHVPSPGVLRLFWAAGHRRFVLEGRESGGHVGPRSSFVLWEQALEEVRRLRASTRDGPERPCQLLLAGGVHDTTSAAMASAVAAAFAAEGCEVGVQLGTAYLFTSEAVGTGATVAGYQEVALACGDTLVLESGGGHATRCARTAYGELFEAAKERLLAEGASPETVREELERLNVGRLRAASRGVGPDERTLDEAGQLAEGCYMLGQVAALRHRPTTLEALHAEVAGAGAACAARAESLRTSATARPTRPRGAAVAVVGMACFLPGAHDPAAYWRNIRDRRCCLGEIPPERWDWRLYYDPDPRAQDRCCSKWGGFIDEVAFDPVRFGMPPASLRSVEPGQLLALELARRALADAGYDERPFDRSRAAVVIGVGGGIPDQGQGLAFRTLLPHYLSRAPELGLSAKDIVAALSGELPEWNEDSFAGMLANVGAGRVANRFDFHGPNFTVDAACASSLAAVEVAVRQLQVGTCDLALAGGCDTLMSPFAYMCFSKTLALSTSGRCRPLDAAADGIIIAEGLAVAVLKRLADAERDGDRIYAVVRGIGASSDGRAKGITAPRPEGQLIALRRAYEDAAVDPGTVDLVEMHATGTVVGDKAEIETLQQFLGPTDEPHCALGSVKSMIGHTKCSAGLASLLKASLALHHKALPPTCGVDQPNARLLAEKSPVYANTATRPWLRRRPDAPRRAGVSAFGFGGTNFHAVLEEYVDAPGDERPVRPGAPWPAELFVWRAASRAELAELLRDWRTGSVPDGGLTREARRLAGAYERSAPGPTVALVAGTPAELAERAAAAETLLAGGAGPAPDSVYFQPEPPALRGGLVAALFPGQGSQHVGMLGDLALTFDVVRERFERAGFALRDRLGALLGDLVFPPPASGPEAARAQEARLTATRHAQPALGAADLGAFRLLQELGVQPAMAAGHSYGELVALAAAGAMDEETLYRLSEARGRLMAEASAEAPGGMAAVKGSAEQVQPVVDLVPGLQVANLNGPRQTVVAGPEEALAEGLRRFSEAGVAASRLPVACAFHTPAVAGASRRFTEEVARAGLREPALPVFGNSDAAPYPRGAEGFAVRLGEHLARPVRFHDQVLAMHDAGARIFVEAGPRTALTGLVRQILDGREHVAVALEQPGRPGTLALLHALGRLAAAGLPLRLAPLFAGRCSDAPPAAEPQSERVWMVNGFRARPSGASAPPVRTAPTSGPPAVMARFGEVMNRFLDVQREVMAAYLAPRATAPTTSGARAPAVAPAAAAPVALQVAVPGRNLPAAPLSPDDFRRRLVGLVSERTGYPVDALGLDLDLEGDLGVDSIKRLEILGALQESFPGRPLTEADAQDLPSLRTLRAILGWLEARARAVPRDGGAEGAAEAKARGPLARAPVVRGPVVRRAVVVVVDAPLPTDHAPMPAGATVVLTDDGRGVAGRLAARLTARGLRPVLARMASGDDAPDALDPARPATFERFAAAVRAEGPGVAGLVHLAPLAPAPPFDGLDLAGWRRRLARDVTGLFLLARALEPDLTAAAAAGGAFVLGATALGGAFGADGMPEDAFPGAAGVSGFLKSLAREWSGAWVRAVDLEPGLGPDAAAEVLAREWEAAGGPVEVGWRTGRRVTLAPREVALDAGATGVALDQSSVVLVVGGARGIAAEAALRLAATARPTLVLTGRAPLPPDEAAETAGLADRELVQHFLAALRAKEPEVKPVEAERAARRVHQERQARATLRDCRAAGARVEYQAVDARDEAAVRALVDSVHERHGRLDVVVFAAGVIEDRLVAQKSPESFERVLGTKADGAFILARSLEARPPAAFVLYSSVAARLGNRGQADYAAGNEAMAGLARRLAGRWPGRVVVLDWGPWAGGGMVSEALEREFAKRGVPLVPRDEGARCLTDELARGPRHVNEVVLSGAPSSPLDDPVAAAAPGPSGPLLAESPEAGPEGSLRASRRFSTVRDRYLGDHVVKGHPVVPLAFAAEWVLEVLQARWPAASFELADWRIRRGLILEGSDLSAHLHALPAEGPDRLEVTLRSVDGAGEVHYAGAARRGAAAVPRPVPPAPLKGAGPLPLALAEACARWLFHGPLLRAVLEVNALGEDGVDGVVDHRAADGFLADAGGRPWLAAPVALDAALQLVLLWVGVRRGTSGLPTGFRSLRVLAPLPPGPTLCRVRIQEPVPGLALRADVALLDGAGAVAMAWDGIDIVLSREWLP